MRSNVMEFWSFCDSTSSRVENELKPIELLTTDVEIKRVTVVKFRVNERSCNSAGSFVI